MKTLVYSLVILFVVNTSISAQNLADSLIFYYNCNGNLDDLTSNGLDAASTGVFVEDQDGNPNSAILLDGTDQAIQIPYSEKYKVPLPASYYVRFKINELPETVSSAILETDYIEDAYYGFRVGITSSGTLTMVYGDSGIPGPPSRRTKKADITLVENKWYDLVTVWEGPQDMTIYISCREIGGEYSGTGGPLAYHPSNLDALLGRGDTNSGVPGPYLNCTIDEAGFWNRALTPQDVTDLCAGIQVSHRPELVISDLQVFQNADRSIQVNFGSNNNDHNYSLRLYDILGREIFTTKLRSATNIFNPNNGYDGIYFYQITSLKTQTSLSDQLWLFSR